jgi:hypothetical protein
MVEIQVTNNIVIFLTTPSLKNVVASSSNEKEEKQYRKKLDKIKPTNFHNVPKLIINYKELMFKLLFVHIGVCFWKPPKNL